jgi:hypothetical protein
MAMSMTDKMREYRIVLRPSILGDRFCAVMLRQVYLDGNRIDVWHQTYCEADTPENAVDACVEKIMIFRQSDEYKAAISY